jgi:pimeloyl-ACP methyl ester carboxylesterase
MQDSLDAGSRKVARRLLKFRLEATLRRTCFAASGALLLSGLLFQAAQAQGMRRECSEREVYSSSSSILPSHSPNFDSATDCVRVADVAARTIVPAVLPRLIVIGFMGGRVKGNNLIHKEALLARDLQERYPLRVYAAVFANHKAKDALKIVLQRLDANEDGHLSRQEKMAARIVIYGHSWGGSETVAFARRLNALGIPVLLTIQIDSVQKLNEDDEDIPPNVREAVNFYQAEGLLRGRGQIRAIDPHQTTILGNYESFYRNAPIACTDYPWFARTFMKSHIEIENDPAVWGKIAMLIRTKFLQGHEAG